MIPALNDCNRPLNSLVNQPVLAIDAAGPIAGPSVFQGFGTAKTFMGGPLNVLYQHIDPLEHLFIGGLPIQIVLPAVSRPA